MAWLCGVIEDALRDELHLREHDYTIEVKGPPELYIGVARR